MILNRIFKEQLIKIQQISNVDFAIKIKIIRCRINVGAHCQKPPSEPSPTTTWHLYVKKQHSPLIYLKLDNIDAITIDDATTICICKIPFNKTMFSPPSGDVFGGRGVISVVGEERLMFLIEKLQLTIMMRSKGNTNAKSYE